MTVRERLRIPRPLASLNQLRRNLYPQAIKVSSMPRE
jgi:hypothetical protein